MQMPDIRAGSNIGQAKESQQQATRDIMNTINQGVANQLSIIQNYQQRKYQSEEAQKERDFKAGENEKQMKWHSGENQLQRDFTAKESKLQRESQERINKNNNREAMKRQQYQEVYADLEKFRIGNKLTKEQFYLKNKDGKVLLDEYGFPIGIQEQHGSNFSHYLQNNKPPMQNTQGSTNYNLPMSNDGEQGGYNRGQAINSANSLING